MLSQFMLAQEFTQQWLYIEATQDAQTNDELLELWEYYAQNPINLNDSLQLNLLSDLQLLTIEEINLIKTHCSTHQLESIYQLQILDISLESLKRIKDFLYIPSKSQGIQSESKSFAYIGIQYQHPRRIGNSNGVYTGSPYKSRFRYRNTLRRGWNLGLNLEKDIGEPLWYHNQGANNLTINLIYHGNGKLKKVLLGKYDISIGEGLLFGTSYRINNPYFLNYQPTNTTKSVLSSKEYNYFYGAAAQWQIRNTELDIFESHRMLHGKSSINKTGLFRSKEEIEARKTNEENLIGVQFSNRNKQNTISWAGILYQSEFSTSKSRLFQSAFISKNYYNLNYSGEIALENLDKWALLQKLNISISNNSLITIQYRSRNDSIFNEYRSDYSCFSNGYENGFYYAFQHNFDEKWRFRLSFDHFSSNSIKNSTAYLPQGAKVYGDLFRQTERSRLLVQYQLKKVQNAASIQKLKFLYQESSTERIRWNTIAKLVQKEQMLNSSLQGNFYYKCANKKNNINISHCVFTTINESIYWQAPYFYGNFNARFLSGTGSTTSLSFQRKLDQSLKIGLQVIQLNYYDREVIGSGNEMIDSNSKIEISVYLKWNN